jgi:hypothetical protein
MPDSIHRKFDYIIGLLTLCHPVSPFERTALTLRNLRRKSNGTIQSALKNGLVSAI